ncbi:14625_t:CDS:2, partial [Acaulospora colombiana]
MKPTPVGSILSLREGQSQLASRQTKWEAVEAFWREVELEEIEKDNQLLERKMDRVD